jgi:hypothetical protein
MRHVIFVLTCLCFSVPAAGEETATKAADIAALEQRIERLEQQASQLQQDLEAAKQDLQRLAPRKVRAMTPQDAVNAFLKQPDQPVTVEFGVEPECAAIFDGLFREGEDPIGPMRAIWDNRLADGKSLTAYLPPKVYRRLKGFAPEDAREVIVPRQGENAIDPLRSRVAKHIEENGIRVTGTIQRDSFENYFIQIDDPANVVTYIKGSGQ